MTESKLITAIGEELECPVCAEYFTDARFLSCMHAFCKTCLQKCDKTFTRGGKSSMNCPLCREQTCLGKDGVASLKIDFKSNKLVTRLKEEIEDRKKAAGSSQNCSLNCQSCQEGLITAYCLSCCHFICASCQALHTKLSAMRTHEVVPMKDLRKGNVTLIHKQETKTANICSEHNTENEWFCYTCVKYMCELCYLFHHSEHECGEVISQNSTKVAVQKVIGKLSGKMISLTQQKTKVKRLRASVKRHFGLVKDKLRNNHELRIRTITRVMKEKHEEMARELADDEELILAKIASVDESLGHAESRAVEARAIGNNAVNDGEHAQIVLMDDYLKNVVSSLDEDNTAERTLQQIERFVEGVNLTANEPENIESLASPGTIFRPEVWDTIAKCALPFSSTPIRSAPLRSIQFDSQTSSFLLASTTAVYSIDVQNVDGTVKHVCDFAPDHVIQDMAVAPGGSSYYVLCGDNRVRVYKNPTFDTYTSVLDSPPGLSAGSPVSMSCIALDAKGAVVVGNPVTETIVYYTSEAFKTCKRVTDISPLQMAFTARGDLAVVCQRISGVAEPDIRHQGAVTVGVFGVQERWENVLVQHNWEAAAVTTIHGNKTVQDGFYALGIYTGVDGRQLASLAEYDIFGIKKESIFEDIHLPMDLSHGAKPLIAVDNEGQTVAVFTGVDVHLLQKRKFNTT